MWIRNGIWNPQKKGYLKGAVFGSAVLLWLVALLIQTGLGVSLQRKRLPSAEPVAELFNRNCARCHGTDGRGDTPRGHTFNAPDFTDPEWWTRNSAINNPRSLRSIVSRGKAGMPAFGKKLTRQQINLLVDYVRSFRKPERKS